MFYGHKDFMNLMFTTKFSKNNAFIHFLIQISNLNYNTRLWCLIIEHWVWFLPYFWVRSYIERWHNFVRTFHFVFALWLSSTDCCLVEKTENSEVTQLNSSIVLLQDSTESVLYSTAQTHPPTHTEELDPHRIPIEYQFSVHHTFVFTSIEVTHKLSTHIFSS